MSGLLWKLPLFLLLALIVAATTLATRARSHDDSPAPPRVRAHAHAADEPRFTVRTPDDGITRLKRMTERAVFAHRVQAAVDAYARDEGRPPAHLADLSDRGYLDSHVSFSDLRQLGYDAESGQVEVR